MRPRSGIFWIAAMAASLPIPFAVILIVAMHSSRPWPRLWPNGRDIVWAMPRAGHTASPTELITSQAWCSPVHAKAGNLFFPAQAGIFYFWRWMLEKITPNSGSLMPPPVVRLHSRIMPWATWNSPDTLTLSPLPRD